MNVAQHTAVLAPLVFFPREWERRKVRRKKQVGTKYYALSNTQLLRGESDVPLPLPDWTLRLLELAAAGVGE